VFAEVLGAGPVRENYPATGGEVSSIGAIQEEWRKATRGNRTTACEILFVAGKKDP